MSDTPCSFNRSNFTYNGTPQEQAKCLLRPVLTFGHIGAQLPDLPVPLDSIIGQPLTVDKEGLGSYLATRGIREADIGGPLSDPLSPADTGSPGAGHARYFIIHDTSSPNFHDDPFPSNINDRAAALNNLSRFASQRVAHVFINRVGESVTAVNFKDTLPGGNFGTKFARDVLGSRRKGLLLHVELIQPRRRDPRGGRENDALAPNPGFTEAQLGRLALIYVAASVRRGEWMIPAFHAVMDVTIPDAHDDPQNFDLNHWAAQLKLLLDDLQR